MSSGAVKTAAFKINGQRRCALSSCAFGLPDADAEASGRDVESTCRRDL